MKKNKVNLSDGLIAFVVLFVSFGLISVFHIFGVMIVVGSLLYAYHKGWV